MKLSLRLRVLILLVAINVAVVGGEAVFLATGLVRAAEDQAQELADELSRTLIDKIQPEGGLNVAPILSWPSWHQLKDAVILSRRMSRSPSGEIQPLGVALNPLGRLHRPATFDRQAVYAAIARAIDEGRPVEGVLGGRVVPIGRDGQVWGAYWYVADTGIDFAHLLLRYILPAFVFSTVLISGASFFALRRFVLDPVGRLARASRRVAEGDLSVRLNAPPGGDEISELMRAFDGMTTEVQSFNARLEAEVQLATEQARLAEAAAMTQRRLAAMGELAAGIAHEINNPLGGLLNAVEVLSREETTPARRKQYLELLSGGLERIRRTVGQLLRFTPRQTAAGPVQVVEPVKDAIALVRHRAQRQGVTLSLGDGRMPRPAHVFGDGESLPAELEQRLAALPKVDGEAHELGQAVLNLLVNALDAVEDMPPGAGHVTVVVGASGERVTIEVADNGPGVAESELGKVSDLFFTTKAPGKGTGLGLSIVHNVATGHGGSLELWSRPGQGFRATLVLPARMEPGGQPGRTEPGGPRSPRS